MDSTEGSTTPKFVGVRIYGKEDKQIAEYWVRDYPDLHTELFDSGAIAIYLSPKVPLIVYSTNHFAYMRYEYD